MSRRSHSLLPFWEKAAAGLLEWLEQALAGWQQVPIFWDFPLLGVQSLEPWRGRAIQLLELSLAIILWIWAARTVFWVWAQESAIFDMPGERRPQRCKIGSGFRPWGLRDLTDLRCLLPDA